MNLTTRFTRNWTPGIDASVVAGFALVSILAQGQTSIHITVSDPRPLVMAAERLEQLSGIPINYEDVRYENLAEMEDVTDKVTRPEQRAMAARVFGAPGARIIVPAGGELSILAQLDPATGKITDVLGPLNALLAAHQSKGLPGVYAIESLNGAFFITPSQVRNARGSLVPARSVLATPVNLPFARRTAAESLQLILDEVSKESGFKLGMGMVPVNALIQTETALGAAGEPARDIIARLLASVASAANGAGRPSPAISYQLLFSPRLRYYIFNARITPRRRRGGQPRVAFVLHHHDRARVGDQEVGPADAQPRLQELPG